jgi:hypothetical protein
MAKGIDRLLLGGALAVGGLLHHRVGQVGTRVSSIEQTVQDQAEQQTQATAPPPGMPLPTGYGLQVRGPAGEDILLPVCLPPGFELDSMVLRPAFLPHEERRPAPVHVAPALAPEESTPAPAEPAPRDRLVEALQLVYSEPPSYQTQAEGVHPPARRMAEALERLDRLDRRERDLSVL